jgi:hypothetical protein
VALVGDGVLAVAERVPELDSSVARAGDDLAIVGGEGDGEDIVGVANKTARGHTSSELPEAEGLVPRCREGVGTVRRDDLYAIISSASQCFLESNCCIDVTYAVGNNVRVAMKTPLGVTVCSLVASKVPDDEGLISGSREKHIRAGSILEPV